MPQAPNPITKKDPVSQVLKFEQRKADLHRERGSLHIMVVEDDPITQAFLQKLFSEKYDVTVCGNPYDAVNEYMRVMPDLVFLDIELGDKRVNGLDVLYTLMVIDPGANIIILSGHATPQNIATATRSGAVAFVAKPFKPDHLLRIAQDCEQAKKSG